MEGYAKLSSLISTDAEFYRKFGALNAQNLLYYQAELIGLEDDLRVIATQDRASQDSEKREFADSWNGLSHAEGGKDLQLQKVMQIRKTLKEYSPYILGCHASDVEADRLFDRQLPDTASDDCEY